ncbi:hypothetical protein HMPREF1633_10020 [Tissierellia bacterium S5-A11]|nr:hypothetical protein HMPREF1633_10020 [Tissierellia bacterium S5-A11]
MQEKKKGSKWSIIIAILVCALTIPASYYYRGEFSPKWIIGQILFAVLIGYGFEFFQGQQRKKYDLEESSKEF